MFESVSRSFALIKESWKVISLDKEILLFPVLSGVALLFILLSFVIPVFFLGYFSGSGPEFSGGIFIIGLFLFYLLCYFVVIYFNTALITCSRIRLTGGNPVFMDGIRNANAHLVPIFIWAMISATVGLVLQLISEKAGFIGQIIIGFIGMAWSLITYFAIPVMIFEEKGPVEAIKESASLFRKTWGETLVGQGSIGIVMIILGIAGLIPVILALMSGFFPLFLVLLAVYIIFLALLIVIGSSLQGVYNTALYLYATTGNVPEAYSKELIENAFAPKQVGGMKGNI
jgi:Family of unknown function (DUF6159)